MSDQAVADLRGRVLERSDLHTRDVFVRGEPRLKPLRAGTSALPAAPATPGRGAAQPASVTAASAASDPVSAEAANIFNLPEPRPRVTAEMAAVRGLPVDTIPGTSESWSSQRVAQLFDDWIGSARNGTENERQILDVTHGLHIQDRVAVAEHYALIRSGKGDGGFKDASGRPLTGDAAMRAFHFAVGSKSSTACSARIRTRSSSRPS